MYVVIVLQIVILIILLTYQKQIIRLGEQVNGLQERYSKEDYDAFFESLRECEEEAEGNLEKEFISPIQYLRDDGNYGRDYYYEGIKVHPSIIKYKKNKFLAEK